MNTSETFIIGALLGYLYIDKLITRFCPPDNSLNSLHSKIDTIMGELQDIQGQLDTANLALSTINENLPVVDTKLTGIETDVAYLKKKLEEGANNEGGISQADAKVILASVTTLATGVTELKDKFASLATKAAEIDDQTDSSEGQAPVEPEVPAEPTEPAPPEEGTGAPTVNFS